MIRRRTTVWLDSNINSNCTLLPSLAPARVPHGEVDWPWVCFSRDSVSLTLCWDQPTNAPAAEGEEEKREKFTVLGYSLVRDRMWPSLNVTYAHPLCVTSRWHTEDVAPPIKRLKMKLAASPNRCHLPRSIGRHSVVYVVGLLKATLVSGL